jgi:hypothetical protein
VLKNAVAIALSMGPAIKVFGGGRSPASVNGTYYIHDNVKSIAFARNTYKSITTVARHRQGEEEDDKDERFPFYSFLRITRGDFELR